MMKRETGRLSAISMIGLVIALVMAVSVARGEQAPKAQKLNLNTATFSELNRLPGIGPITAERILEFRSENGPFERVEELMNVRGIGEKKFLNIRELITVEPPRKRTEASP